MAAETVPEIQSTGVRSASITTKKAFWHKRASHPMLELSIAVFSVLTSASMSVASLAAAVALFSKQVPTIGGLTGIMFMPLYNLVMFAAFGAILFALLAWVFFRRSSAAIAIDKYKVPLQIGAGIAFIKTVGLSALLIAAAITPLLTLREGSGAGMAYLNNFLPTLFAAGLFALITWYLVKLVGKVNVSKNLSLLLVVLAGVAFVLSMVAVIVHSHPSETIRTRTNKTTIPTYSPTDTWRY